MGGLVGTVMTDVNTWMLHGWTSANPVLKCQSLTERSLSALAITDTELKLMAAAAIIGLSSRPNTGYSAPAATGTRSEL